MNSSDSFLHALWIAGALASLVAIAGRWQRASLAVCLVMWLSLCSVGQDFLAFQWDTLLTEVGFLALFADATLVRVILFRWLLFRLMFFSGAVKLLSRDPVWRDLSALQYHYETQPLPTPIAWYMHQLPLGLQKASTLFVFATELLVPFLFFAPKRFRHVAGVITIVLQLLIMATGNYAFFNLLAIALTMWLWIDWEKPVVRSVRHTLVTGILATFIGIPSLLLCLAQFNAPLPPGGPDILHAIAPLRLVNSYGLFAVMTTARLEIVIEGSNDSETWQAYEFPYKPGDVFRAPPVVAPHQPRLDWQMWFAALGSYQQNRWFVNLMLRLLQGDAAVERLMRYNPFPNSPPRYIRARLYHYHLTHFGERAWWSREERGLYFPEVSIKQ